MTGDDSRLLQAYVQDRSEAAFGELVRRHLTLVYSAALRRTGDVHRAQDVAQIVFTALARDAAALRHHPALTGWLYTVTRRTAINLTQSERRRQKREEEALTMEEISAGSEPAADWAQLRPVLDDAMDELGEQDREAVLLRFFDDRPFAAVAAVLRVSEEAARKRVDRALDRLGGLLAKRGITSTGIALATLLESQAAVAAPAGAAASITAAALAGTTAGGLGAATTGIFIMSTTKTVAAITTAVAVVAIGFAIHQMKLTNDSAVALAALRGERNRLADQVAAMAQHAQQADSALAATRKEPGDLQSVAAKPVADPAAVTPATMDYWLEHPETQAAFLQKLQLGSKMRYERFFKTAGLSTEQQDKAMKAVDRMLATEVDVYSALHAQGYGPEHMPQDPAGRQLVNKMAVEGWQQMETELKSALGDDGYKSFQEYSGVMPERNVADQLASELYGTSEPLTATQADQLVQILAQNRFTPQTEPSSSSTLNGTFIDPRSFARRRVQNVQQNGSFFTEWAAPVTDTALNGAETVLTPAQLAALRDIQARQAIEFRLAPPLASEKTFTGNK